jgi:hypothetical protein
MIESNGWLVILHDKQVTFDLSREMSCGHNAYLVQHPVSAGRHRCEKPSLAAGPIDLQQVQSDSD